VRGRTGSESVSAVHDVESSGEMPQLLPTLSDDLANVVLVGPGPCDCTRCAGPPCGGCPAVRRHRHASPRMSMCLRGTGAHGFGEETPTRSVSTRRLARLERLRCSRTDLVAQVWPPGHVQAPVAACADSRGVVLPAGRAVVRGNCSGCSRLFIRNRPGRLQLVRQDVDHCARSRTQLGHPERARVSDTARGPCGVNARGRCSPEISRTTRRRCWKETRQGVRRLRGAVAGAAESASTFTSTAWILPSFVDATSA